MGTSDRFGWHNWGYRDCRVHKQAFRGSKYSYYIPYIYDLFRPLRLSLFALNSKTKPTNPESLKHREQVHSGAHARAAFPCIASLNPLLSTHFRSDAGSGSGMQA